MSNIFSLKVPDFVKAAIMAVLVPVIGYIATAVQSGSFAIDWHQVGLLALSGFLGYLVKQFGTSTTVTAIPAGVPLPPSPSIPQGATSLVPTVNVTEKVLGVTVQNTNSAQK